MNKFIPALNDKIKMKVTLILNKISLHSLTHNCFRGIDYLNS